MAHLGRRPNAHQRSALDWLYPTCAVEGCGVRSRHCQTDHRTDWATSHVTVLELLDRLCKLHHDLKTYQGWGLVEGKGKRAFVAPEDPRHPRHGACGGPAPGHRPAPGRHRRPAAAQPAPRPGPAPSPLTPTRAASQPGPPGRSPACRDSADLMSSPSGGNAPARRRRGRPGAPAGSLLVAPDPGR